MKEGTFVKIIGGNKKYVGMYGHVTRNLDYGLDTYHVLVKIGDKELCYRRDEIKRVHVPECAL